MVPRLCAKVSFKGDLKGHVVIVQEVFIFRLFSPLICADYCILRLDFDLKGEKEKDLCCKISQLPRSSSFSSVSAVREQK